MTISTGTLLNNLPVASTFDDQSRIYATRPTGTPVGQQVPPSVLKTYLDNYYQPSGSASGGGSPSVVDGRLTFVSGTAIPTTDQTAQTRIWYQPYVGNKIGLYDGAAWQIVTVDSPVSVAVPSVSGTNFDIFGYASGGVLALETVNWTNGTTRATALTTQNGILVKSGDATRRYLGTGRATSVTGQSEDSFTKRFLWNYYNRADRVGKSSYATSHTYNVAAWREWNNATTPRVELVIGIAEESTQLTVQGIAACGALNQTVYVGGGVNSTTTNSLTNVQINGTDPRVLTAFGYAFFSVGYNYFTPLQYGNATSAGTFTDVFSYAELRS